MNVSEHEYSLTAAAERERENLFVTSKKNCATSARITTQYTYRHELPDENFITVGAERFQLRRSFALASFHW